MFSHKRSGLICWVLLCFTSVIWAQQSPVQMVVDPAYTGIGGIVRPGSWTPMRLTIDNTNGPTRQVIVGWSLKDMDQDTVLTQQPQSRIRVWHASNLAAALSRPHQPNRTSTTGVHRGRRTSRWKKVPRRGIVRECFASLCACLSTLRLWPSPSGWFRV